MIASFGSARIVRGRLGLDALALAYVALPNAFFLWGWLAAPLGLVAAALLIAGTLLSLSQFDPDEGPGPSPALWSLIVAVAAIWSILGGQGHWMYANSDWVVRDAVLVDLVRDPWPVTYVVAGIDTTLRAPLGYYLPAAAFGKLFGLHAAESLLAVWTMLGVCITFALMLRDRPGLRVAVIRLAVFVLFSGMDIIPTIFRHNPHAVGDHLEWWAGLFQYSSQTTQLFWVPNHTIPGWIAVAWLLAKDPRRLPIAPAILFVAFTPLWAPLTALGTALLMGCAIVRRTIHSGVATALREVLDIRLAVPVLACLFLIYPYITAGSDKVPIGYTSDTRFVGDDFAQRYVEFVCFEFVGFALLLLRRNLRDPLLWASIVLLLVLPFFYFGPANDLAMRTSMPALTLMAIQMALWLSSRSVGPRDGDARLVALILLAVGAVTPFMEFARSALTPAWPIDASKSVIDVTRGTHYLTPSDHPWLRSHLKQPTAVVVETSPPR